MERRAGSGSTADSAGLSAGDAPGGLREPVPAGFEYSTAPKETTLSPAGHPVQFANTANYFPGLAAPRPGGFTKPPTTPTKKP